MRDQLAPARSAVAEADETALAHELRELLLAGGRAMLVLARLGALRLRPGAIARYHFHRNRLAELAAGRLVRLFELPGGDVLLLDAGRLTALPELARAALIDDDTRQPVAEVALYELPGDEARLRALLESYVTGRPSAGRPLAASLRDTATAPVAVYRDAAAQAAPVGRLGPRTLLPVVEHLETIDLGSCLARRVVRQRDAAWRPDHWLLEIDLAQLRGAHFPGLLLDPAEPLFAELRHRLDRLLIVQLLFDRPWICGRIGVRLGLVALRSEEFVRLEDSLDAQERQAIIVGLDWAEALADLGQGGRVLGRLREAGFKIAVRGLEPSLLGIVEPSRLVVDHVELRGDGRSLHRLAERQALRSIRALDPRRVYLAGCADALTLTVAAELGINLVEGAAVEAARAPEATHQPRR
jgi:hypothetical protein